MLEEREIDCERGCIHQVSTLFYFKRLMDTLWKQNEYDFIYVSIGSKFNESQFEIMGYNNKPLIRKTNAVRQMIPEFLFSINPIVVAHNIEELEETPETNIDTNDPRILCISIDHYDNIKSKTANYNLISEVIKKNSANIDFIQYEEIGSLQIIEELIYLFIEKAEEKSIPTERFMIANYVRFLHCPNHTECFLETRIPEEIHRILFKTRYSSCFYQWYGYQHNLYNLLYNYNHLNIYISVGFTPLITILNKTLKNDCISQYNINDVAEYIANIDFNRCIFEKFLKHSIDITSFSGNLLS